MTEESLTLERAADLARRGFQPIDIELWVPDPERPGFLKHERTRTPREVCRLLRDVLGEYPVGGEEGLHTFPYYDCGNCPADGKDGMVRCNKYTSPNSPFGHGPDGKGPCDLHKQCTGYVDWADCPWPTRDSGHLAVFSVRGSSEGDYVHVEQGGKLILLAKTFQGRDAAWTFARNLADLLGV